MGGGGADCRVACHLTPDPSPPLGARGASAGWDRARGRKRARRYEHEHEQEHEQEHEHEGRDCWGGWLGVLIRRVRGLHVSSVAGFGQPWQDKQSQHE